MSRREATAILLEGVGPAAPRWESFPPADGWHYSLVSESIRYAIDPASSSRYVARMFTSKAPKRGGYRGPGHPTTVEGNAIRLSADSTQPIVGKLDSSIFDAATYYANFPWHRYPHIDTREEKIAIVKAWAADWMKKVPFAAGYIKERLAVATGRIYEEYAGPHSPH